MINKVILIGNLGCDPTIRFTQNGTPVASFRIATTEKWKDNEGQTKEKTEWHQIIAWQRLAEICGEYLTKGVRVYVEGKLQTRKWKDNHDNDRYTTEIVIHEMKMLSPRNKRELAPPLPESGFHNGESFQEPPPMGEDVPF